MTTGSRFVASRSMGWGRLMSRCTNWQMQGADETSDVMGHGTNKLSRSRHPLVTSLARAYLCVKKAPEIPPAFFCQQRLQSQ